MSNEITEKVEVFLQNIRCENKDRETLVHLESCRMELEKLKELEKAYKKFVEKLNHSDRAILEMYVEQMLSEAFAKQQEAYVQGLFDAFQILQGLGILSTNENVEKIISDLKNGSPQ